MKILKKIIRNNNKYYVFVALYSILVQFVQLALTLVELINIMTLKTDSRVILVNLHCEVAANVLNCQILVFFNKIIKKINKIIL